MKNKFERRLAAEFAKKGIKAEYEPEKLTYTYSGTYRYDFRFKSKSGKTICVEGKGYLRPEHKRVLLSTKRCHPELDLRIVFYENRKKQIKWATKYGFKYAIGSVPDEWYEE